MLIQHSGSLAGGYREGIHSFTAPRKERGKKPPPSLALNGMKKRWETLTLWDKKKKSHTLTYFLFRYILQDWFTFRWQRCRDVLPWKKKNKKKIITWGRNINTWCSRAGGNSMSKNKKKVKDVDTSSKWCEACSAERRKMHLVSVACNLLPAPLHPSSQADGSVWRLTEKKGVSITKTWCNRQTPSAVQQARGS